MKKKPTKKLTKKQLEQKRLKFLRKMKCIGAGMLAVETFLSAIAVISIIKMEILKEWQIWLVVGILTGMLVLVATLLIQEKTKKTTKIAGIVISLIVSLMSLAVFRYTNSFNTLLDRISLGSTVTTSDRDLVEKSFIVYISGSDAREGIKETARSDVNIVAVVNPKNTKILLVTIPRDTYVRLHETTGLKDKLTHAGMYGIEMSRATIEDFLEIKIDRTVKVSFETVIGIVDELDGIEVESDTEMNLKIEGKNKYCYYTVGRQKVDGDCALRFSRERKTYGTGDLHRVENQQQVLTAMLTKLSGDKGYLLKLPSILEIVANSFETSFAREEIASLIRWQLETGAKWQIESITITGPAEMLPTYTYGENMPLYVMHAKPESVKAAQEKIAEYR